MEQASLPSLAVQCSTEDCKAQRGSASLPLQPQNHGSLSPHNPAACNKVPSTLLHMNLIVSQESEAETQQPQAAKRCSRLCWSGFSPVARQSQNSTQGLGLRHRWSAQTSAGSQLQNGMESNINIKNRCCTTFSVVLFCLWGEGEYWERWRWPLAPCYSDKTFSTNFWLLLKYNEPFHEAALGNKPHQMLLYISRYSTVYSVC